MYQILQADRREKVCGVLFDMDGVVIDSERLFTRFWMESAADLGFPMTRDQALQLERNAAAVFAGRSIPRREHRVPRRVLGLWI